MTSVNGMQREATPPDLIDLVLRLGPEDQCNTVSGDRGHASSSCPHRPKMAPVGCFFSLSFGYANGSPAPPFVAAPISLCPNVVGAVSDLAINLAWVAETSRRHRHVWNRGGRGASACSERTVYTVQQQA